MESLMRSEHMIANNLRRFGSAKVMDTIYGYLRYTKYAAVTCWRQRLIKVLFLTIRQPGKFQLCYDHGQMYI